MARHVRIVCWIVLTLLISPASAQVVISEDRGGRIGEYIDKWQRLADSKESVMIDGLCASACTLVVGAIPPSRICATKRARLGFHAAWNAGPNGTAIVNPDATSILMMNYPPALQRWIRHHGGLSRKMIFLSGRALSQIVSPCGTRASEYAAVRTQPKRIVIRGQARQ